MLTVVLAFLLLLIALLAIPVTLVYQISWQESFQGDIKLLWLFGLIRMSIPISQTTRRPTKNKVPTKKIRHKKKPSKKKSNPIAAVWHKSFRKRIMKFIRDLWRAIHKRDVCLRLRIGLDDPADTGRLWAFVGPISGMLTNIQEASIEIEPEFFNTTFELNSSGSIRVIPLQMILLTVSLLLSPPLWQGIKKMRHVES